jgi:hypothetical protein
MQYTVYLPPRTTPQAHRLARYDHGKLTLAYYHFVKPANPRNDGAIPVLGLIVPKWLYIGSVNPSWYGEYTERIYMITRGNTHIHSQTHP